MLLNLARCPTLPWGWPPSKTKHQIPNTEASEAIPQCISEIRIQQRRLRPSRPSLHPDKGTGASTPSDHTMSRQWRRPATSPHPALRRRHQSAPTWRSRYWLDLSPGGPWHATRVNGASYMWSFEDNVETLHEYLDRLTAACREEPRDESREELRDEALEESEDESQESLEQRRQRLSWLPEGRPDRCEHC